MKKLSEKEKAFAWSCATGTEADAAYQEHYKTGRLKLATIQRNALALYHDPRIQNLIEKYSVEAGFVDAYIERKAKALPRARVKATKGDDETATVTLEPDIDGLHDPDTFLAQIAATFGSLDGAFNAWMAAQVSNLTPQVRSDPERATNDINGALSAMNGIAPRDELECMLAAQMVAIHMASMESARQAATSDTPEHRAMNLKQAGQLMRTFTQQLEALNKHRGKGQQKMTVEHVHVHDGGQAIVGNVQGGEGVNSKNGEQGHAQGHAECSPVWSEDEKGNALPVARDA